VRSISYPPNELPLGEAGLYIGRKDSEFGVNRSVVAGEVFSYEEAVRMALVCETIAATEGLYVRSERW